MLTHGGSIRRLVIVLALVGMGLLPNTLPTRVLANSTGTVSGIVFRDTNRSGAWEPAAPHNEKGVGTWAVFSDANGNTVVDAGEPQTTPAADGTYTLAGLTPGAATICVAIPALQGHSTPRCQQVLAVTGQTNVSVDFGVLDTPYCARGSITVTPRAIALPSNPSHYYLPNDVARSGTTGPWAGTRLLVYPWTSDPVTFVQAGESLSIALLVAVNSNEHPNMTVRYRFPAPLLVGADDDDIRVVAADGTEARRVPGIPGHLPATLPTDFAFFLKKNGDRTVYIFNPLPTPAGGGYQDLFVNARVQATTGGFISKTDTGGKVVNGRLTTIGSICGDSAKLNAFTGATGVEPDARSVDDVPEDDF
jgi:hypothetical protein